MQTEASWTKPFYGVQHLEGLPNAFLVTVTDRGEWADVAALSLRGDKPFTPVFEQACDTAEEARHAGERFGRMLLGKPPVDCQCAGCRDKAAGLLASR